MIDTHKSKKRHGNHEEKGSNHANDVLTQIEEHEQMRAKDYRNDSSEDESSVKVWGSRIETRSAIKAT